MGTTGEKFNHTKCGSINCKRKIKEEGDLCQTPSIYPERMAKSKTKIEGNNKTNDRFRKNSKVIRMKYRVKNKMADNRRFRCRGTNIEVKGGEYILTEYPPEESEIWEVTKSGSEPKPKTEIKKEAK